MQRFASFFLKFKSNLLVNRAFLLNAAFAMTIMDFIIRTTCYNVENTTLRPHCLSAYLLPQNRVTQPGWPQFGHPSLMR
jgi:hypothetical protein